MVKPLMLSKEDDDKVKFGVVEILSSSILIEGVVVALSWRKIKLAKLVSGVVGVTVTAAVPEPPIVGFSIKAKALLVKL